MWQLTTNSRLGKYTCLSLRRKEGKEELNNYLLGVDNLHSRCYRQFALFDSTGRTSAVQFETNAIYGFVSSSIYSRKK